MNRERLKASSRLCLRGAVVVFATLSVLLHGAIHRAHATGVRCASYVETLSDLQAAITAFIDPANSCTVIEFASDLEIDIDLPVLAVGEIDALEPVGKSLTIEGYGHVLSGVGLPRGLLIHLNGPSDSHSLTVRDLGMTGFGGSGAVSVTTGDVLIERSRFADNTFIEASPIFDLADASAGAFNALGRLTVVDSEFVGNQGSLGGAIHSGSVEQIDIFGSTFADNTASTGGAIYTKGPLSMANSTVAGNMANSASGLNVSGTASLIFITVVNNASSFDGAAVTASGNISCTSSIIYGNLGPPAADPAVYADLLSTEGDLSVEYSLLTSSIASQSLVSTFDIGNTNLIGIDPELLPLGDHGGFTLPGGGRIMTHAPRRTSPAIDAVGPLILTARTLDTDQRGEGYLRFVGDFADIGSIEHQPSEPRFNFALPEVPAMLPTTR